MLDIKFVAENVEEVKKIMANRSGSYDVDAPAELYAKRKQLIKKTEEMKAERNRATEEVARLKKSGGDASATIAKVKEDNVLLKQLDDELSETEAKLKYALLCVPNIPDKTVPIGKDDGDNVEIRKIGEPTKFDFAPKAHWELGDSLGILDPTVAAKITGTRFTVYRGAGARLERAIINFMLDSHINEGYTEVLPPFMVNRDSMTGTGQLPKFEEDAFAVKNTDYFLVPTAEVPVTNLHRGEILPESALPIKYCAYTACFRGEAGSAGRDTRGLIRQHQFNKVELVKFTRPEDSVREHEELTACAENILKALKIPYRVVCLCTGDLGFSAAKTYDIEVWMPSYNRYVEISSCSNYTDYQARRMNIKYRRNDGKLELVHTLNGSGLAVGRTTAAVLENFQNADGTVTIPEALRPYMGGMSLIARK
ncbi:MAG: serine--tRNA ligase [Clostridia bacterium]|nr:serine--tRNA ligase [Clostridia bacterium]